MFAAREQENLVHGHQQLAASKQLNLPARGLQPKTQGNKHPKTPLKVPLNDENAIGGFGVKSIKGYGLENIGNGGKSGILSKDAFITPAGPKTRAPLGAKTTNAKAKNLQTPRLHTTTTKGFDKTQTQASTRRPRNVVHAEPVKIEISCNESPLKEDRDIEYCPPNSKDLPFESDDFPLNCLDYGPLKGKNLNKGIHKTYHQKELDEIDILAFEQGLEDKCRRITARADEAILRSLEEDWKIGDMPANFSSQTESHGTRAIIQRDINSERVLALRMVPSTIVSRNAASALASQPRTIAAPSVPTKSNKPKASGLLSKSKMVQVAELDASTMRHTAAVAASKSTIGYSKGRCAVPTTEIKKRSGGMTRSASNLSQSSDVTITPARFAKQEERDAQRLPWLSAFEADLEPLSDERLFQTTKQFYREDSDAEEFVMTLEP